MKDSLFPVSGTPTPKLGSASSPASFRLRARRSLFAAAPAPSRALTRPENKPHETANPQNRRFLWAFVCVGGYLFVTSVVGLSGADFAPRCRCGVDAHRYMLLVAALAQLAVFLALSLGPGADGDALAGLDVTGAEAKLSRAVRAHRPPRAASRSRFSRCSSLTWRWRRRWRARRPAGARRGRSRLGRGGRRALREAPREALPGAGGRRERRDGWVVHGGWSTRRERNRNRNRNRLLRARRACAGPRGRRRRRRRRRELGRRVGERRLGAAHAVQVQSRRHSAGVRPRARRARGPRTGRGPGAGSAS